LYHKDSPIDQTENRQPENTQTENTQPENTQRKQNPQPMALGSIGRTSSPSNITDRKNYYNHLLVGRFRRGRKIGTGSFGDVFRGYDVIAKTYVAIKQEIRESNTFVRELEVIKHLQLMDSTIGIPKLFYDGANNPVHAYRFFVMELLGENLCELQKNCGGTLSTETVCKIAAEIIDRFEELHEQGIVHRDVKPQNFLIGNKMNVHDKRIYICDFGLSGRYINENGNHIPFTTGLKPIGTARYASMRVHRGYERSRRDDFEALAYMLIYLLKGSLPWQGLQLKNRNHKWRVILAKKKETTLEELCQNCISVFKEFVVYCRAMRFNQRPKYGFWRKQFLDSLTKQWSVKYQDIRFKYDWEIYHPTDQMEG